MKNKIIRKGLDLIDKYFQEYETAKELVDKAEFLGKIKGVNEFLKQIQND